MLRSENSSSAVDTQVIADIACGKSVIETARILGLTDDEISQAVKIVMSAYKVSYFRPSMLYSDFQSRLQTPMLVSPDEYIGHAMRTQGTALATFLNAYADNRVPHREHIISLFKAMVFHAEFYLGLDTMTGASIKSEVRSVVKKHREMQVKADNVDKARIEEEVETYERMRRDTDRVARMYESLVMKVSGCLIKPTSMLSVSAYEKDSVSVHEISWERIAGYIRDAIREMNATEILKDPDQWPEHVRSHFRSHVEKDMPAQKMLIVGDQRYLNEALSYESSMLDIFIPTEAYKLNLLNSSSRTNTRSVSTPAAAAAAASRTSLAATGSRPDHSVLFPGQNRDNSENSSASIVRHPQSQRKP